MVQGVDPRRAGIQLRWWNPFHPAALADAGLPAALFDQPIVWPAGQPPQVRDVGFPTCSVVGFGVMALAEVGRDGAAGIGAPAIAGVEHHPLPGEAVRRAGPDTAAPPHARRRRSDSAGHGRPSGSDRTSAASSRRRCARPPAASSSSVTVVVTTTVTGSPLCSPNSPEARAVRAIVINASCWRCPPRLRVSAATASADGVPLVTGVSSFGLHMPVAASLPKAGSR